MKRCRAGFTLLEILVVVGIILLLLALIIPILSSIPNTRKKLLAQKQISEIYEAAKQYHQIFGAYPPDRKDYGTGSPGHPDTVFDPATIYKYLAHPQNHDPFLTIPAESLKGQIMVDPWGDPYEFDAMHMQKMPDGTAIPIGEPCSAAFLSTPNPNVRWDVKVWSAGLDTKWANGSNTGLDKGKAVVDADNQTNWAGE